MKTQQLRKFVSVFLAVALMFTMLPGGLLKASAASTLTVTQTVGTGGCSQDSDGNITITQNGNYTITGDGSVTTNTITVTGCTANVTLKDADIEPGSGCAFKIASGAAVNLTLSGANTLKSKSEWAGLDVPSGTSVSIVGSGSLIAYGGQGNDHGGAGIGNTVGGSITIVSGTVTANGYSLGAGISGASITISGGIVTATGGSLGFGLRGDHVHISGGTVTAHASSSYNGIFASNRTDILITGGSVRPSSVSSNVIDGNGKMEYCVTTDAASIGPNQNVTGSVDGGPISVMQTDSNAKLYFWMPASGSAMVNYNGNWYSVSVSHISGPVSASLTAMETLNITDGSITASDGSITQGSNTYNTNDCIITQSGSGSTQHTVSVTGGAHSIILDGVNIDVSSVSNQGAFAISNNKSSAFVTLVGTNVLKSGENFAGLEVAQSTFLSITAQNGATLDSTGGQYGAGIGGGGNTFDMCGDISIAGGDIKATGGFGLDQYGAGGAGIGGGASQDCGGGKININGGSVKAYGQNHAAGIGGGSGGNGGTITITGGTVEGTSPNGGAGIGGGDNGSGGTITITGGIVKGHNEACAAGIGGGFSGAEGTVNISGGTVIAEGHGSDDIGNGEQYSGSAGQTTITGGSVKAGSVSGPTNGSASIYKTNLTLPSGSSVQSLAVKQVGAAYNYGYKDMQTDNTSNGKLYLWLPANDNTTADLKTDGGSYTGYHGKVDNSNTSVLKMDQDTLSVNVNSSYTIGEPLSVSTTGGSGTGGVTYDYKSSSGTDFGAVKPTALGSYTVTAIKAGDDCYYPATSAQQSFVMIPNTPTISSVSPSGGTAGTSVTITGLNLTDASVVKFGRNPAASYTINSGTSITATAPVGSGAVDITVTTPNGTSAVSAADQFTYDSSDATLSGLTISPGALNETFSSGTFNYTANAGSNVSEVTVTPTVNESHATFKVDGNSPAQGQTGVAVALSSDDITTRIPIEVTAQSGASQTYYVTVTKSDPAKPVIHIDSNGYVGGAWTKIM